MSLESFYWFPTVSTDWMEHAACRGMDPNLFVVSTTAEVKLAKRICNGAPTTRTDPGCPPCPVKAQCLEYCLSIPGPVLGVWGGTADRDRREIRRDRNPDGIRRRRHQHHRHRRALPRGDACRHCGSCRRGPTWLGR